MSAASDSISTPRASPAHESVQRVEVRRVDASDLLERDLAYARRLAWVLDAQFSIGRFRFGLDALIGLLPVAGDTATALAGIYFAHLAYKHRLGRRAILSILAVQAFDWLIGLIPWLGDLFDAGFKAHLRSLKILETAAARRPQVRS